MTPPSNRTEWNRSKRGPDILARVRGTADLPPGAAPGPTVIPPAAAGPTCGPAAGRTACTRAPFCAWCPRLAPEDTAHAPGSAQGTAGARNPRRGDGGHREAPDRPRPDGRGRDRRRRRRLPPRQEFAAAGAEIAPDAATALAGAGVVFAVQAPVPSDPRPDPARRAAGLHRRRLRRSRPGSRRWPRPASTARRWSCCRASPARSRWTCCPARPTSPATAR